MKVVINSCYGGFGLSYKAVMRYAELKGIKLYVHFDEITKRIYGNRAVAGNPELLHHYTTEPPTSKERINKSYFNETYIPRDDHALVQVVEEMGGAANGQCANLKIVEITDGVAWEIDEYDGRESIEETHMCWS